MPKFRHSWRACTECGRIIPDPRKGQYQHDGDCRKRAVRDVTRIVGKELAKRIYWEEVKGAELPEMEPHRSRQRKACLNATVPGNAISTEGETE